jgi:hypothetical protein
MRKGKSNSIHQQLDLPPLLDYLRNLPVSEKVSHHQRVISYPSHTYIHTITMAERSASVERKTSETSISCSIVLDNEPGVREQKIDVSTGIGFLDHVSESSYMARIKLTGRCSLLWPSTEECL